jgi:uroporphyrinogen-III decarboxylase
MTAPVSIPLGVGFYPDWWYKHFCISFDKRYYFDPETRIEARMEMDKRLYDRFGDVGLGDPNPKPKPLITASMTTLPAIFGCEIVYEKEALPWAMPLNLSEDEVMKLEVPDLFSSWPMTEWIKQIDYLKKKYGKVIGDINTTGIQNLALKLRGDELYIDYFENPELCHHLLRICTECVKKIFEFNYKTTGTGAVDVTPMADPKIAVIPNCTEEQISNNIYESFLLQYDKRCRQSLGSDIAVNARISPVLMKNGTAEEVAAEVKRLIDEGFPLENYSIDTVGLTHGTPDENVKTARSTAQEYGKIDGR